MSMRRRQDDKSLQGKVSKESLQAASYIFSYMKPYKWYFIGGMVLLFMGSMLFMIFPFLAGQLIDVAQGEASLPIDLRQGAIILLVLLVVQGLFSYFRVIAFAQVSERSLADLRRDVFKKLITLPIPFFEGNKSGEIISRVTGDVEKLYSAFSVSLAEFIRQIIILIIGIGFLVWTMPRLTLIMLATFPLIVIGAVIFGRYIRKLSAERQDRMADTNNVLSDAFQAIAVIKAYTNEWNEVNRFGRVMDQMVSTAIRYARSRGLFAAFIITVLFGGLFLIIWQGAVMIQRGEISAGQLVTFVSYTAVIGGAMAGLGNFYTDLLGALGATERIRGILLDQSELEIGRPSVLKSSIESARISFEQVSFHYPSRPDIEVLKDISLEIGSGQTVAIVGPSGAGKSTIVQLILRFYEEYEGLILLNGQSIKEIDMLEYRSLFGIVSQEIVLFSGSIEENIRYGSPDATDVGIEEAAKNANAWEFISSFPEGMQTKIGERGIKLSGGQRQRIAIARALLNNPRILILDEATSNLDSESEGMVQEALKRLMKGRTSIVIAHRLSTIQSADQILVINNGEVVESGKHDELIAQNGMYAHLVALQLSSQSVSAL